MNNKYSNEKKMKKTILHDSVIIFLIFLIILLSSIGIYAWAKYISTIDGTASAQVAKWNFKVIDGVPETTDVIDFVITRTDNFDKVVEGKLAPGTFGEFQVGIDARGTETILEYVINIDLENKPKYLTFYYDKERTKPISVEENRFSIDGFMSLEDVKEIRTETIYWEWPYESGDDEQDTIDSGKIMKMKVSVTGYEILSEMLKLDIKYNLNGGINNTLNPTYYYYGSNNKITLAHPTKEGYTFSGWTGSNGDTVQKDVEIDTSIMEEREYIANWVDDIPPTQSFLEITSGTLGTNNWYKSNVNVKITPGIDSGSQVSRTVYTLSGATTQGETELPSTGVITIEEQGETEITVYVYDNANNVSTASLTVKIDSVAPIATLMNGTFANGVINGQTSQLTISNVDIEENTSGINRIEYYNGRSWTTNATITGIQRNTVFKYRVIDNAGNVGESDGSLYLFNRYVLVVQAYEKMLGRNEVTVSESTIWASSYYNQFHQAYPGHEMQLILLNIVLSDEANRLSNEEFANRLYQSILGRECEDPAILQTIVNNLNAGTMDRETFAKNLINSAEFKQICDIWGFDNTGSI